MNPNAHRRLGTLLTASARSQVPRPPNRAIGNRPPPHKILRLDDLAAIICRLSVLLDQAGGVEVVSCAAHLDLHSPFDLVDRWDQLNEDEDENVSAAIRWISYYMRLSSSSL